jgi:UPF0755 protein
MIVGFFAYQAIYAPNTQTDQEQEFIIEPNDSTKDIVEALKRGNYLENSQFLEFVARLMSFDKSSPKPGRYLIRAGSSSYEILNMLRKGEQQALKITIHQLRNINQLAGLLGNKLMTDSLSFLDHFLNSVAFRDTVMCHFLPDTYEFYWTVTPEEFERRMKSYHDKYWSSRVDNIERNKLTPCEAYILASIVEKESAYDPEKPRIAGVYINRLKRGIPLQADPTVLFAMGDQNIRRVLYKHLEYPSPYNTYLNPGLPPGPICMPSKASIEAVVNAESHAYIYFCAKADGSGKHAFAKTLAQHNRNARAFQSWLNKQGIRK